MVIGRLEKCKEQALLFNTRMDFKNGSMSAYSAAVVLKILDQICSHMKVIHIKWTKESCLELIKSYKSLNEIREKNGALYSAIYRLKLNEDVHNILGRVGNRYNKCIYSYEFPDNSVYVGLTYNIEERQKNRDRNINDSVTKHIIETGLQPIRKQLTDYINVDEAAILEGKYVEKYKNDGWIILNQVKTGAIGGITVKWTESACAEEAKKYDTKVSFREGSSSAYVTAKHNKFLDSICSHMKKLKEEDGYFTKEKCIEIGKNYTDLKFFIKENNSCYVISKRNGWRNDVYGHMINNIRDVNTFFNEKTCLEDALKYDNKSDYRKNSPASYDYVRKHGFLSKATEHMKKKILVKDYWTLEKCIEESKIFFDFKTFKEKSPICYRIALNNKWIDIICSHFIRKQKPHGYWNDFENCKNESLKYTNLSDFKAKSPGAFAGAKNNNFLKEITTHFIKPERPIFWTLEKINECFDQCSSIKEIKEKFPSAYNAAKRFKIVKDLTKNMERICKPSGYWNDFENCKNVALNISNRTEYKAKYNLAYKNSRENGWLDIFFGEKKNNHN